MATLMTLGLVLVLTFASGGCVSKSKYMAALQESEIVKGELEKTKAQEKALEQQIGVLRGQNKDLNAKFESTTIEVRNLTDSRDREREDSQEKVNNLEQQIDILVGQQRTLRQQFRDAKDANATLKSLVVRYEKELKESPLPAATLPPPTVMQPAPIGSPQLPIPESGGLSAKAEPPKPTPPPTVTPVSPPSPKKSAPPIPQDQPNTEPMEEGWFDMIKRWLAAILDWLF